VSATVERFVERSVLRRRRTLGAPVEKAGLHERGRQACPLLTNTICNRTFACPGQCARLIHGRMESHQQTVKSRTEDWSDGVREGVHTPFDRIVGGIEETPALANANDRAPEGLQFGIFEDELIRPIVHEPLPASGEHGHNGAALNGFRFAK
jgi:hypothetical protein